MTDHILTVYAFNLNYAKGLVADLDAAQMTAQPSCQGAPVLNHPAWVLGHLCTTGDFGAANLGANPVCPQGWADLFGGQSKPQGPEANYPSKQTLLAALEKTHENLAGAFRAVDPAVLTQQNPVESLRAPFPQVGDLLTFILTSHAGVHLGQLSAWRRAMGLPSVF